MAKKKQDLSLVVWVFGWLLALATALKKFALKLDVPFEAFERLGSDKGEATIEKIVELVHADWLAEQPKPKPRDTSVIHRIRVSRGPLPSFAELETEYGQGCVSSLYDGRPWTKSKERLENDVSAEEVDVLVKDFAPEIASGEINLDKDGYLVSEDLIAWGLKHGWSPADEKETYQVGRDPKTRDLQRKSWLVGLGSSTLHGVIRYVAVLGADDRGRVLRGRWFDGGWDASDRFLFVRKVSSAL